MELSSSARRHVGPSVKLLDVKARQSRVLGAAHWGIHVKRKEQQWWPSSAGTQQACKHFGWSWSLRLTSYSSSHSLFFTGLMLRLGSFQTLEQWSPTFRSQDHFLIQKCKLRSTAQIFGSNPKTKQLNSLTFAMRLRFCFCLRENVLWVGILQGSLCPLYVNSKCSLSLTSHLRIKAWPCWERAWQGKEQWVIIIHWICKAFFSHPRQWACINSVCIRAYCC